METFDIFEAKACTNPDIIGGFFIYEIVGYFRNEADAIIAGKGKGGFGTDAEVKKISLVIFDSLEEFQQKETTEKRTKALSKLSEEDRQLLGV